MIPKMSSKELNEIFKNAQEGNVKFEQQLLAIKKDINAKLKVVKYEEEYVNQMLSAIDSGLTAKQNVTGFLNNSYGIYNSYGHTIHPKFNKTPIDIFNLKLPSGDNYFKQHVTAKINDVERPEYVNVLMADNHIEKEIVFDEFDVQDIKLEYSLNNEYALSTMRFNVIEIHPYLAGGCDLVSIEIYSLDDRGNITSEPIKVISGYGNMSRSRIILDNKYKFNKVVFNFRSNFKTESNFIDIYPFGLKHIHFYECDFQESSFVIAEFSNDKFIDYVMDDITLYSVAGPIATNANRYGIEIYTDYISNTLTGRVILSSDASIHRIAKNTKKLYVKIPLLKSNEDTKEYLSLYGIKLNFSTNEEIII